MRRGRVELAAKAVLRAVCRRRRHVWLHVDQEHDEHRLLAVCTRCGTALWAT